MLYFYPADDTPGCTKEACGFRDAWDELAALAVTVLGVSPDAAESHGPSPPSTACPSRYSRTPTDRSCGPTAPTARRRCTARRVTGVIRSTVWIGPDGRVRRHWPRVTNAAQHPGKVLEAMRAG